MIRVSPIEYIANKIMGYFKKSNLYIAKTKKTDNKNASINPKNVSLSAFLKGKFIILLPKINNADSHIKWCEKGFNLFKIIPLFR